MVFLSSSPDLVLDRHLFISHLSFRKSFISGPPASSFVSSIQLLTDKKLIFCNENSLTTVLCKLIQCVTFVFKIKLKLISLIYKVLQGLAFTLFILISCHTFLYKFKLILYWVMWLKNSWKCKHKKYNFEIN